MAFPLFVQVESVSLHCSRFSMYCLSGYPTLTCGPHVLIILGRYHSGPDEMTIGSPGILGMKHVDLTLLTPQLLRDVTTTDSCPAFNMSRDHHLNKVVLVPLSSFISPYHHPISPPHLHSSYGFQSRRSQPKSSNCGSHQALQHQLDEERPMMKHDTLPGM